MVELLNSCTRKRNISNNNNTLLIPKYLNTHTHTKETVKKDTYESFDTENDYTFEKKIIIAAETIKRPVEN